MSVLDRLGFSRTAKQNDDYEGRLRRISAQTWQELDPVLVWIPLLLMFFGLVMAGLTEI